LHQVGFYCLRTVNQLKQKLQHEPAWRLDSEGQASKLARLIQSPSFLCLFIKPSGTIIPAVELLSLLVTNFFQSDSRLDWVRVLQLNVECHHQ
jgi:hypothetical protein